MKEILEYLFNHHTLSKSQAKAIMIEIAQNKFNATEVTAFISIFLMRNITLEELKGFREALLQMAVPVNLNTTDSIDIVGTGGDGKNTINISTLASFVVAGTGQKVTKHGNYGASTVTGSSNVLEALGYQFKKTSDELNQDLEKANICFLHAPYFHPALQSVGALRKSLGLRTFFNLLGPLVNPAKPQFSVIGVYNLEIARLYQYLLQKENQDFVLVHGMDGYDEISLTQDSKIITKSGENIYSAEDLGFKSVDSENIKAGETIEETAKIFKNILEGNGTESQNAVVLANAAVALHHTQKYGTYEECLTLAKESLFEGKALNSLQSLVGG
ncbi:anthranilate phosphoribosyltransferase [Chryseobacterium sp. Ch-15]|uniref:Anthranilate phosphoribosyltransferase n=1 Tax=Chryseobacterium muglaense TaxID=2893752 RepID=A0A9Q3YTL7_9FLAO|nr:anthranilate phosphoribosyltransferase [Chryseobacterium muglaense]MBD3904569.1 anthranilate phosphoribosyltransferase [Chryseobacterium muglaense]MCC9036954.1 anthranilate phosphoribosyltransferase [Chryseobacterium muglaense]MCM2554347.1 anthranilate phosphoribosyltransferase [Chryseobacterium muglaense]